MSVDTLRLLQSSYRLHTSIALYEKYSGAGSTAEFEMAKKHLMEHVSEMQKQVRRMEHAAARASGRHEPDA